MPTIYGEVTAEDIAVGCKGDPEACPVWRSMRRVANKRVGVTVSLETIELRAPTRVRFYLNTPRKLRDWIERFDAGKPVKPITWSITGESVGKYFKVSK